MAEKIKAKSGTSQGFEIVANREGFGLACLQLAMQTENNEQVLQSGGNHWHFAEWNSNLEPGSDEFIIVYKPDL